MLDIARTGMAPARTGALLPKANAKPAMHTGMKPCFPTPCVAELRERQASAPHLLGVLQEEAMTNSFARANTEAEIDRWLARLTYVRI